MPQKYKKNMLKEKKLKQVWQPTYFTVFWSSTR